MMTYIANRRFSNTPVGTETETNYEVGDLVPDFESWPEHARYSLLRQDYVKLHFAAPIVADTVVVEGTDDTGEADKASKRATRRKP